ncbi:acetylglutamate kinase [Verrucomicrobiota bacterium]|nr:acetylglutamate kinase [Verrucomicrobiota bacterium]
MSVSIQSRVESLIEALPYIQQFRGKLFVIKYGGSAMEDDAVVDRLLRDIVFLEAVGINPVVIHGGGKAISQRMRDAGQKPRFVNGLRVTDAEAISIVESVLDGVINADIAARIVKFGGRAVGIHGKTVLVGKKLPLQTEGTEQVDLGFVGEVVDVNATPIEDAVHREVVPVISPLARDGAGVVYNINADIAAAGVAGKLKAAKMIYVSDVPGLMRDPSNRESLIPSITLAQIEKLIAEGVITGGMIPKVESAAAALRQGVEKVHFIDGRTPHALLVEVFSNQGIGTEITAS